MVASLRAYHEAVADNVLDVSIPRHDENDRRAEKAEVGGVREVGRYKEAVGEWGGDGSVGIGLSAAKRGGKAEEYKGYSLTDGVRMHG